MKFKVGDTVRRISDRRTHVVSDVSSVYVYLDGQKLFSRAGWDPDLFELVQSGPFQIYNKPMTMMVSVAAPTKPRVQLESPLGSKDPEIVKANVQYAKLCMLDCLSRGEAPFASHLLYTQVLDDNKPEDRKLGIEAGLAFTESCSKVVVYIDRGISAGMLQGIKRAQESGKAIEYRSLQVKL